MPSSNSAAAASSGLPADHEGGPPGGLVVIGAQPTANFAASFHKKAASE